MMRSQRFLFREIGIRSTWRRSRAVRKIDSGVPRRIAVEHSGSSDTRERANVHEGLRMKSLVAGFCKAQR
jgi:hypothetical protein